MDNHILQEQIAYYRAGAHEYDASTQAADELRQPYTRARELLRHRDPCEDILELASGTGDWTQDLLKIGRRITAIDTSPEMIELARQKLPGARVQYQQADLFQWEPERAYDLVFFANWLSHVPPQACRPFLQKVARAVRPGGAMIILDQFAPMAGDIPLITEGPEGKVYAQRTIDNGQSFTIVKVFYQTQTLRDILTPLSFEVHIEQLDDCFFFLEAQRASEKEL